MPAASSAGIRAPRSSSDLDALARRSAGQWSPSSRQTPLADDREGPGRSSTSRWPMAASPSRRTARACHGAGGGGAVGYPNLIDDDWLWGGTTEAITATITHGDAQRRSPTAGRARCPPSAATGLLKPASRSSTSRTMSARSSGLEAPPGADIEAGAQGLRRSNCVTCHGENGKGNRELGAPNLTDAVWLYGSSLAAVVQTITNARNRLDAGLGRAARSDHDQGADRSMSTRSAEANRHSHERARRRIEATAEADDEPLLPAAREDLSAERQGHLPPDQVDRARHHARHLLPHPVHPLGPRPRRADQAVLVDLPGRRFYFFFIEIWPQEVYYLTGLLILAARRRSFS